MINWKNDTCSKGDCWIMLRYNTGSSIVSIYDDWLFNQPCCLMCRCHIQIRPWAMGSTENLTRLIGHFKAKSPCGNLNKIFPSFLCAFNPLMQTHGHHLQHFKSIKNCFSIIFYTAFKRWAQNIHSASTVSLASIQRRCRCRSLKINPQTSNPPAYVDRPLRTTAWNAHSGWDPNWESTILADLREESARGWQGGAARSSVSLRRCRALCPVAVNMRDYKSI